MPRAFHFVRLLLAGGFIVAACWHGQAQEGQHSSSLPNSNEPADESWAPAPVKGFEWISDLQNARPPAKEVKFDGPQNHEPAASGSKPSETKPSDGKAADKGFDAAIVSQGQSAFNSDCTQCHDAQRSTGKSKSLADWKATVGRMANKDGANVPAGDRDAIATYLASLGSSASGGSGGGDSGAAAAPPVTISATI
ncbi:MAG TPA: hypothetical protein VGJ15_07775, partial [Pirellulales bacterium]